MRKPSIDNTSIAVFALGGNVIITHGNGPQVGNLLLQNELVHEKVPKTPLAVLDAMTRGSMGYMIEQSTQNAMDGREGTHIMAC